MRYSNNMVALLAMAAFNSPTYAALGEHQIRWSSGVRSYPHSRRNKLGSHKQTMRKLGKLR